MLSEKLGCLGIASSRRKCWQGGAVRQGRSKRRWTGPGIDLAGRGGCWLWGCRAGLDHVLLVKGCFLGFAGKVHIFKEVEPIFAMKLGGSDVLASDAMPLKRRLAETFSKHLDSMTRGDWKEQETGRKQRTGEIRNQRPWCDFLLAGMSPKNRRSNRGSPRGWVFGTMLCSKI